MKQEDLLDRLAALENQLTLNLKTLRSLREEIEHHAPEMKVNGWTHIPIQARARALLSLRQAQDRSEMGANRWPELLELLAIYKQVTGKVGVQLGDVSHDKGTLALVVLFDAGYTVEQLATVIRLVCKSVWWLKRVKDGQNPGLSNFTPEVARRAIDQMSARDASTRLLAMQTVTDPGDPEAVRRLVGAVRSALNAYVTTQLQERNKLATAGDRMSPERIQECCEIYWRKHAERAGKLVTSGATAEGAAEAITTEHRVSDKPIIARDAPANSKPRPALPQRTNPLSRSEPAKVANVAGRAREPSPERPDPATGADA